MFKRIRKAIVAGLLGGVSAVAGTLTISGAPTKDDVSKAIGTFILAAAVTSWATWRTPNAPTGKTKVDASGIEYGR